jgi:hypothetical protein
VLALFRERGTVTHQRCQDALATTLGKLITRRSQNRVQN